MINHLPLALACGKMNDPITWALAQYMKTQNDSKTPNFKKPHFQTFYVVKTFPLISRV